MTSLRKIGIMGGTFNPVHKGHLTLAENAYEQFELEMVYFMPSSNPPHKDQKTIISDEHRVNMVQLAIKDNPHFAISMLELQRAGTTYTVDTLDYLTKQDSDTTYYFILGADSLFQIETWQESDRIFKMAQIVVATRYHISEEKIIEQIKHLENTYHANIDILKGRSIDVSSKQIRESILENLSIKDYVPDEVEEYIHKHRLYLRDECTL